MVISILTREQIKPNSQEVKMIKHGMKQSGKKITIPVEEWERISFQARYYCNLYSKAVIVMRSQAKMLENYITM